MENFLEITREYVPEKVVKTLIIWVATLVALNLLEIIFVLFFLGSVLPRFLNNLEVALVIGVYLIRVFAGVSQLAGKVWELILKGGH